VFADKRILTIDDSATIRSFLRALLQARGGHVDEAATGLESLARCAENSYDLILLDLLLPDINGIDVLTKIRERDDRATVVMLTGAGGIKSAINAVRLGADGYIEKQELSANSDCSEFFWGLEQASEHRAGLLAQKQLQAMRGEFYSMITHDLRNPMSSILLTLDMLLGEQLGALEPAQTELLLMADESAKKLLGLINDYLDFSKIEAGYLRLDESEVDLQNVLRSSTRFARLQANARQQELVLDLPAEPVMAWADPERIEQVLDNLISNAIKYTPAGGKITVCLRPVDGMAVFEVSDTGQGVPPDQLPLLFSKYHRVPGQATRHIQGTGLGLLIVREIIQAHGGSVEVHSDGTPGMGSTFTVHIPLRQAE
jgi:signal transduction histidine kinase